MNIYGRNYIFGEEQMITMKNGHGNSFYMKYSIKDHCIDLDL